MIKLYNTFTRSAEILNPLDPPQVGLYCCGPTVYDFQHIGNFKTFLFEDLLVRTLRFAGYKVKHVMNITDVGHLVSDGDEGEDKMIVAMRREAKSSMEIADYYTNKFFEDWDKLNLTRPDVVCRASEHILDMIELIKRLESGGFTYQAAGNIYFNVAKFKEYGKLALLDLEKLKAGARIEVDRNKKNPFDFVLWFTRSKFENQEMQWDSPWGRGYPGWHIECSAMSIKYLGEKFDIHCGGIDHIPVHHTNEIAQSEAATGKKPWVSIWMHSQFMNINNEKMSKSTGRFIVLDDLIKQGIDPLAYRFLCLGSHYRSHLNFSLEALQHSANNLEKLRTGVLTLKKESPKPLPLNSAGEEYLNKFKAALFDDLNSPRALAVVWELLSDRQLESGVKLGVLYKFDNALGFGIESWQEKSVTLPANVQELVNKRDQARKAKDWALSDAIRKELVALGFQVEDSSSGTVVK